MNCLQKTQYTLNRRTREIEAKVSILKIYGKYGDISCSDCTGLNTRPYMTKTKGRSSA